MLQGPTLTALASQMGFSYWKEILTLQQGRFPTSTAIQSMDFTSLGLELWELRLRPLQDHGSDVEDQVALTGIRPCKWGSG